MIAILFVGLCSVIVFFAGFIAGIKYVNTPLPPGKTGMMDLINPNEGDRIQ